MSDPAGQSTGARQQRRRQTRERILDAAGECFRRAGVARTRMEDIAAAAGMQRPHLYRHFPAKDDLVREVIADEVRRIGLRLREQVTLAGPTGPVLVRSLVMGLRIAQDDEITRYLVSDEAAELVPRLIGTPGSVVDAGWEYWGPVIGYGRERGELRGDLEDLEIARWFISQQFLFLHRPDLFAGVGGPESFIERFVVPAVLRAGDRA